MMLIYNPNVPVLLMVFNRPDFTKQVFEQIQRARPPKLYISADGPRNEDEKNICAQVREIVTFINWECQIHTLFHDTNQGCRIACTCAIAWFFENEPEGIILEDDCIPSDSFFSFCSEMLERYRNDERIGHISGGNYQNGIIRGDGSYYFSALTNVGGGWAGWRRVWKDYDINIATFPDFDRLKYLDYLPSHHPYKHYWNYYFKLHHENEIDGWDFQYAYLNLIHNRLSIIPNVNLITNIGCNDSTTTHYIDLYPFADLPRGEIDQIVHPSFIISDTSADIFSQSIELKTPQKDNNDSSISTMLKEILVDITEKSNIALKIPRIIHQIYEDMSGPPDTLLRLAETWKKNHPNWKYCFWNKTSIEQFMEIEFPELIESYKSFAYDVERWDIIRYLIIYRFGGLYVDMDYECFEPLDALLFNRNCCMGLEPTINAIKYNKEYIVGNAFMASIPHHDYFKDIIYDIFHTDKSSFTNKAYQIIETTGPFMTTRDRKSVV